MHKSIISIQILTMETHDTIQTRTTVTTPHPGDNIEEAQFPLVAKTVMQ